MKETCRLTDQCQPLTPETVSQYWLTRWTCLTERIKMNVDVPFCTYTQTEIAHLINQRRVLIYCPAGITLSDLARIHPEIKSSYWSERSQHHIANLAVNGWVDVDADPAPQNTDTTDNELLISFGRENRYGLHLTAYIIAMQDVHDRTGRWSDHIVRDDGNDEARFCRLLGSWHTRHRLFLAARFYPWGELSFAAYSAGESKSSFSARSMGVKRF